MKIEKQFYNLSNDYLFKLIFSDKQYLRQLLLDGFGIKVGNFHYIKESLTKENKNQSIGVFDIIIETEKEIIIVEMQNQKPKYFENRAMIYATKKYSEGFKRLRKDDNENETDNIYSNIKPIICCWVLNYNYDNKNKELLEFKMLERKIHKKFGENIKILLLSLKAQHKSNILNQYELLANADNIKELESIRKENQFKSIVEKMEYYNMDEETYKQMERSKSVKERYELDLMAVSSAAYHEGETKGEKRGISVGEKKAKLETAKNLLAKGFDLSIVLEATGLKEKQIKEYQKQLI